MTPNWHSCKECNKGIVYKSVNRVNAEQKWRHCPSCQCQELLPLGGLRGQSAKKRALAEAFLKRELSALERKGLFFWCSSSASH